ncbi:hypothetical protein BGW41_004803 [Actinomortierella wolfii]|nr:hypothetical protein BGW41_004803 [Actinomortierella wolfii]
MGNTTSADNARFNELLHDRATQRRNRVKGERSSIVDRTKSKKQQQQQQQQQQYQQHQYQQRQPPKALHLSHSNNQTSRPSHSRHNSLQYGIDNPNSSTAATRQKLSDDSSQHSFSPTQAEFYDMTPDLFPITPTSPTLSSNSTWSPSSPASSGFANIQQQHLQQHQQQQQQQQGQRQGHNAYHSMPIVIPQRQSQPLASFESGNSVSPAGNGNVAAISPSLPAGFTGARRGSEQPISSARVAGPTDNSLLGTSPEALDWLKQKPTRSTTHMIHTYNYSGHNYYQPPGSVKVTHNMCRNMAGLPNFPSFTRTYSSNNTSALTRNTPGSTATSLGGASASTAASSSKPSPTASSPDTQQRAAASAATTTTATRTTNAGVDGPTGSSSSPPSATPHERPRSLTSPISLGSQQSTSHFNGHFYGHGHGIQQYNTQPVLLHIHVPNENDSSVTAAHQIPRPHVGRLTMSRAKLTSPSATSLSSSESESSSRQSGTTQSPPTSPHPGSGISSASVNDQVQSSAKVAASSPPPRTAKSKYRPSSTISSLRVLLANHPQGMSLVESLEEEEDEGSDTCSETETNESEEDARARMQEQQQQQPHEPAERPRRKRPSPKFEWMNARRRFSSSSLSTISREIRDSQKGQHALWKYIGGGNFHAQIRYDIGRILDSGCGLGEWTMEMAKEFPNATVYGIDINPELFPDVNQNVPSNCLFTQSDLLSRLSFPDHYFDFVYQRFLYLGLTVDDWPVALKELHRVMKPGAWIELFEPCMRMHRAGPRTRQVLKWISRLLQENRGLDFDFAGEKMRRLCESKEIGFVNVKVERLSIPVGAWGGRVGEAMAENLVLMFQNLKAALSTLGTPLPNSVLGDGVGDETMAPGSLNTTTSGMDDAAWQNSFDTMVQSWVRECEANKSYFDYYILVGQRAP